MSRKTRNAQSRVTLFRHSAVLSLPTVLLREVPNVNGDGRARKIVWILFQCLGISTMRDIVVLLKRPNI